MGREIRRVALTFDWPLRKTWQGFINPHPYARNCKACDGSGVNPATHQIAEDFYDFARIGRRWCDKITQDEADALVAEGRLRDLSGTKWDPDAKRWTEPKVKVTAEMVNAENRPGARSFGHDAINRWILIKARATRLGVYGLCKKCRGEGHKWRRPKDRRRYERWRRSNPPKGEGWQVWETTSDGSPISPVFRSPQRLIRWLVGEGYSESAAESFVMGSGWVPSGMIVGGTVFRDIESANMMMGVSQ